MNPIGHTGLMATRNPARKPVEVGSVSHLFTGFYPVDVVDIPVFIGFYISQVVVWNF